VNITSVNSANNYRTSDSEGVLQKNYVPTKKGTLNKILQTLLTEITLPLSSDIKEISDVYEMSAPWYLILLYKFY
jgi:hypothetical protein